MRFSDPYTDDSRAAEIAAALKLQSRGRASRPSTGSGRRRGWTWSRRSLGPQPRDAGAGPRRCSLYDLESAVAGRRGRTGPARSRSTTIKPKRPVSPLGDALAGRPGGASRAAGRRGSCWPPTAARTPAKTRSARPRRPAGRTSRSSPIAAGADEGPRNVRLAEVEASPVVFARDPMTLAVVVEARGLRDAEATLVLEQRVNDGDWEPVGNQRIVLGEDGILKRTTFRITPKVVGQYEFRARVEDAGPELTQDDNVATAAVRVVRQQIRVLLIAGAPSPEVQFLRNALMRDQHVEFAAWLQHADPGFRQPGDRPITRLPERRGGAAPLRRPAPGRPRHAGPRPAVARA